LLGFERLRRSGENTWQTIYGAHAVRLRAAQATDAAVTQAAFLRGNFHCGRTKWQV